MAQSFDVVVIGGGPGGYVAAIRAAQLGLKTACIDDWKTPDGKPALGGTCTNIGCIPSKALLQSSENFEQAGHGFAEHGVRVKGLELDLAQMQKRKDQVVKASNDGVVYLFKKNKVAFFHGRGSFVNAGADGCEIAVAGAQNETLTAKNVIIATGSSPRPLSGAAFDERLILSNDGALAIPEVPKRLGVIGAGVVGLEMGSVWRRLGSEVTILEALPVFLGAADEQIAREAWKIFSKQGLKIELGVKITGVKAKKGVTVEYTDAEGKAQSAIFDRLIVSIGRIANTEGLNAEAVGLKLERGFVDSDEAALELEADCFGVQALGVGDAADRDDEPIENRALSLAFGVGVFDRDALFRLHARDFHAELDLQTLLAEDLPGFPGDLFVGRTEKDRQRLEDRHLRPEPAPHAAH